MSAARAVGVFAVSIVLLFACEPSKATAQRRPSRATARQLVLEAYEPPSQQKRVVATNPSKQVITRTIRDLRWSDITFVVLRLDDRNWIEASGSRSDGFSVKFARNGKERVSESAPTLDEIVALFQSYVANDGRWERMVKWQ